MSSHHFSLILRACLLRVPGSRLEGYVIPKMSLRSVTDHIGGSGQTTDPNLLIVCVLMQDLAIQTSVRMTTLCKSNP